MPDGKVDTRTIIINGINKTADRLTIKHLSTVLFYR